MERIKILVMLMFLSLASFGQNVVNVDKVFYKGGYKTLCAGTENARVLVYVRDEKSFAKHLSLWVAIKNDSKDAITFNPDRIEAMVIDNAEHKDICKAYTAQELIKKEKRNIFWFGPDNVKNVTTNSNITTKDAYGNVITRTDGSATTQVYTGDRDKAIADAEHKIKTSYLQKITIFPEEMKEGEIVLKNKKAKNIIVSIFIGDTNFVFDLSKE